MVCTPCFAAASAAARPAGPPPTISILLLSSMECSYFPLLLNLDTSPECDMIFDLFCGILGSGIVPGGIFVFFAIYDDGIVARQAFPGTGCVGTAFLKVLAVN